MGKVVALILGMLLLIFDSKNAIRGAQEGIDLCLCVVIPSIFPMMFLARMLIAQSWNSPKWLSRLFHLPKNSQTILLAGILCGYPVGAQLVGDAYQQGRISHADARRMVFLCSHCGPAFLFGMSSMLFTQKWIPWALWGMMLLSSIITGILIPGAPGIYRNESGHRKTISQNLTASIKGMGIVCGWIILFRVILNILECRCIGKLPALLKVMISGILELSNGCSALVKIPNLGLKFVLCGLFMSMGGVCVTLQILGVSQGIDMRLYFPGKTMQSGICVILTYIVQKIALSPEERFHLPLWSIAIMLLFIIISAYFLQKTKNSSRISASVGV